jgi:hypothetical protein
VLRRTENVRNEGTSSGAACIWSQAALLAALAVAGSWSSDARAQAASGTAAIKLDVNSIARRRVNDPPGTNYPYRNARRWWINYEECRNPNEEYFEFPLSVPNPGPPLEVWAGSGQDCSAVRGNADRTQSCWIVASYGKSEDTMTVVVPVRTVVKRDVNVLTPPMGPSQQQSGLDPMVCDGSTDTEGDAIKFYFFLQEGGQAAGTPATWDPASLGGTGFDLVGPAPPESITIGMGDEQLSVNLHGVGEEPDRERFAAYCSPAAMDDTFIPAEGVPPPCSAPELPPGVVPDVSLKCGEASETSDVITTDPDLPQGKLVNETPYAVGVSGLDAVDNAGPLSPLACGTPKELDDFFEVYGKANGPGGGGFCSVSPGFPRSAPAATALLGALLAAFGLRRSRSRA